MLIEVAVSSPLLHEDHVGLMVRDLWLSGIVLPDIAAVTIASWHANLGSGLPFKQLVDLGRVDSDDLMDALLDVYPEMATEQDQHEMKMLMKWTNAHVARMQRAKEHDDQLLHG